MSFIPTANQVPEKSILDQYYRQTYLGNQYIVSSNVVAIVGAVEIPFLNLLNPSTNAKSVFVNLVAFFIDDAAATKRAIFRIYYNPTTVAAGTPITPLNLRTSSANTSNATCLLTPTVATNGSFISAVNISQNSPNIAGALFILDPGKSLFFTVQPSSATSVCADMTYYEI